MWVPDIARELDFPRVTETSQGESAECPGVPILMKQDVLGVLEFFSLQTGSPTRIAADPGDRLNQLGQFYQRKRVEARVVTFARAIVEKEPCARPGRRGGPSRDPGEVRLPRG